MIYLNKMLKFFFQIYHFCRHLYLQVQDGLIVSPLHSRVASDPIVRRRPAMSSANVAREEKKRRVPSDIVNPGRAI